jgi:hypothetical protein
LLPELVVNTGRISASIESEAIAAEHKKEQSRDVIPIETVMYFECFTNIASSSLNS